MEATCPYPETSMKTAAPCSWELAADLGKATSLGTDNVFTHLLILVSLVLNAVYAKYGGIIGKFPNLLMIQHGAPGEGESVALWLVFQILYYFDSVRAKHRQDKYKEASSKYKRDAATSECAISEMMSNKNPYKQDVKPKQTL